MYSDIGGNGRNQEKVVDEQEFELVVDILCICEY
jgi:hypothetical protein